MPLKCNDYIAQVNTNMRIFGARLFPKKAEQKRYGVASGVGA